MSVGEDVNCEFVKEEIHPLSTGSRQPSTSSSRGRPIAHVAKELGVGEWVKLERERQGSGDGRSDADIRAENARLRRELAEAKMVN